MGLYIRSMFVLVALFCLWGCTSRDAIKNQIEALDSRTRRPSYSHCATYDQDGYVTRLGLREVTLISADIQLISRCSRLELLALSETNVREFDLTAFGKLPILKELYLEQTGLSTDQVQFLGNIRTLTWLGLDHTDVDSRVFDLIGQNKMLRHLGISDTKINVRLTKILSLFPQLEKLVISKAYYSDKEIQAARKRRPILKIFAL